MVSGEATMIVGATSRVDRSSSDSGPATELRTIEALV